MSVNVNDIGNISWQKGLALNVVGSATATTLVCHPAGLIGGAILGAMTSATCHPITWICKKITGESTESMQIEKSSTVALSVLTSIASHSLIAWGGAPLVGMALSAPSALVLSTVAFGGAGAAMFLDVAIAVARENKPNTAQPLGVAER